jgi:hypothetical protein
LHDKDVTIADMQQHERLSADALDAANAELITLSQFMKMVQHLSDDIKQHYKRV